MANPIKYTATSTSEVGAIRSGKYLIGVGGGNYYPTSTTGWWSTRLQNPPVGSYYYLFAFKGDAYANQGPSIVLPQTDQELTSWSISYGAGAAGITAGSSIANTLTWIINEPNILATNKDYEGIVTSGLTFLVDSTFVPSYPKGLTGYYDMGSRGANAINFIGPPTWVASGTPASTTGSFSFDGTNDYFNFGTFSAFGNPASLFPLPSFTMDAWVRYTGVGNPGQNKFIFTFGQGPRIALDNNGKYSLFVRSSAGQQTIQTTASYTDNSWHHVVATVTASSLAIYVDGATGATAASTAWNGTSDSPNQVIAIGCSPISATQGWLGNIGPVKLYDRALSYNEVLQNYNAQSPRYA